MRVYHAYAKTCQAARGGAHNTIDKQAKKSYDVGMINSIKNKYNTYQPGEFLPIYVDGKLANKRDFHKYRLKTILGNPRRAAHQFTHYAG